jgi:hypothetical protein
MKELIKCFPMPLRLYMCILVALVVALQFAEPPKRSALHPVDQQYEEPTGNQQKIALQKLGRI